MTDDFFSGAILLFISQLILNTFRIPWRKPFFLSKLKITRKPINEILILSAVIIYIHSSNFLKIRKLRLLWLLVLVRTHTSNFYDFSESNESKLKPTINNIVVKSESVYAGIHPLLSTLDVFFYYFLSVGCYLFFSFFAWAMRIFVLLLI